MSRLEEALREVREIESFMRRRYLYDHPIFGHITKAVELLEAEVKEQAPVAEEDVSEEPIADPDPEVPGGGEAEAVKEPEVPPEVPKLRRRQNRRRGG